MNVTREEKKAEALSRMKKIGYCGKAKEAFRRSNKIYINRTKLGAVDDLPPEMKKEVEEFEKEYNALVYMVIHAETIFGEMDSLIYVSDHPEEWELDNEDLKYGIMMSYTINHDAPDCSEFGSIGFERGAGHGMVRVA